MASSNGGSGNLSTLHFFFIVLLSTSAPTTCSVQRFRNSECLIHFRDGDFILGGIIPIYRTVNQSCDGPIMERHGVPKVEAMAYAVDMINRRTDLLPNVALGYEIRNDCREEDTSLWSTLTMADPCGDATFSRHCPLQSHFTSKKEAPFLASLVLEVVPQAFLLPEQLLSMKSQR